MPRNSSGTYTDPVSPPAAGTLITSARQTALEADLVTEITDSLSRSGKGGMTAPLRVPDGAVSAPALAFSNETSTGWFRNATGDLRCAVLGVARAIFNSTGHVFTSAVADGVSAVAHVLDTTNSLANSAAKLLSVRNQGGEVFSVGKSGELTVSGLATLSGGLATLPAPTWTTPTLAANWAVTGGYDAKYTKDALGFVHLRGSVASSTGAGVTAFTLPTGYRPATQRTYYVVEFHNSIDSWLYVTPAGAVQIVSPQNGAWYSLDGITFFAEA